MIRTYNMGAIIYRTMLRVLGVSPPEFESGRLKTRSLGSSIPFSLQNAFKAAVEDAARVEGEWHESNLNGSRADRASSLLIHHSFEEQKGDFRRRVEEENPDVIFMGAMSMNYRGAIEYARIARDVSSDVCIVLGGWHPSETFWFADGHIHHHAGSPLKHMQEGHIDKDLFDVVVSGDGEFVISNIGELVASGVSRTDIVDQLALRSNNIFGDWMVGSFNGSAIETCRPFGVVRPINRVVFPSAVELFGMPSSGFDVFKNSPDENVLTAHVMHGSLRGCAFDCFFCSERRSLTGGSKYMGFAGANLYERLGSIKRVSGVENPGFRPTAFVENSILDPKTMRDLLECFKKEGDIGMEWGAQMTLDLVLRNKDLLRSMKKFGLSYLFIGLETFDPEHIKTKNLSKDLDRDNGSWIEKAEDVLNILNSIGIKVGFSVVFGLGEPDDDRRKLFDKLDEWKSKDLLDVVSFNYGFAHPQRGLSNGNTINYTYIDWAVSKPRIDRMAPYFGECTDQYLILPEAIDFTQFRFDDNALAEIIMRIKSL